MKRLFLIIFSLILLVNWVVCVNPPFVGIRTIVGGFSDEGFPLELAYLTKPVYTKINPLNGDMLILDAGELKVRLVSNGNISTIAGNGASGIGGDGILAINSPICNPISGDFGKNGEIYFSDCTRIRIVYPNGTISTFAGTISSGASIDGVKAIDTKLKFPSSIAIHPLTGEVYFIDPANDYFIRKFNESGFLETVAGKGKLGQVGDGGPAIDARIENPSFIMFNSIGELFICELSRIRKIDLNGVITTLVGNGNSGDGDLAINAFVRYPVAMDFNREGDFYFADHLNSRIRKVLSNGTIVAVAGSESGFNDGAASEAMFDLPTCVQVDSDNNVLVCDPRNGRIRKVKDGLVSTYSGINIGDGNDALKSRVRSVFNIKSTSSNEIIIADRERIRKISNGIISTIAVTLGELTSDQTGAIGIAPNGEIYYSDWFGRIIRKIWNNGNITTITGLTTESRVTADGQLALGSPLGTAKCILFNSNNELIYCDSTFHRIRKITNDGTLGTIAGLGFSTSEGVLAINAKLNIPSDVIINKETGDMVIAESGSHRIRIIFRNNGTIQTIAGTGKATVGFDGLALSVTTPNPQYLAYNSQGEILFTEGNGHRVRKITKDGYIVTIAGQRSVAKFAGDGGLALNSNLNEPRGIDVNNDNIYIADGKNYRIRLISLMCNGSYVLVDNQCISFCNGKSSNDSKVCSGHGNCLEPNICNCTSGYYGKDCENMICSSPNYYGQLCEKFDCYGVSKSNYSNVCSGNGKCVDYNNCTCQENVAGSNCGFELVVNGNVPSVFNPKFDFVISTSIQTKSPYLSINYLWKEQSGLLNLTSQNESKLVIKANSFLTEGSKLNLTLIVTINESESIVSTIRKSFETRVNKNPIIDSIKIYDNSTGLQSTSGIGYQTVFKLESQAYSEYSNNLIYYFGFFIENTKNQLSLGSQNTFYFKLPFTTNGYMTCYLTVIDSLLGETTNMFNLTILDPTSNLDDNGKVDYAVNILNSPNVSVSEVNYAVYLLTQLNSTTNNTSLKDKLIDAIYSNVYSKDKDAALEAISFITNDPQKLSYVSQIQLLNLMNENSSSPTQFEKVLSITSNLLKDSIDSKASNLIKSIISLTSQSKASSLQIGEESTFISKNINSTIVKNLLESFPVLFNSSIGISSIKLPSVSLYEALGFSTLSTPIVLQLNVVSKSLYSYQNWNNTSPIFIFKILSAADTSKVLNISALSNPIEFEITVESLSNNVIPKCVYVNEKSGQLSEDGIETIVLDGKLKCRVYHLADFTTIPVPLINQPVATSSIISKPVASISVVKPKPAAVSSSQRTIVLGCATGSRNLSFFSVVLLFILIIGMM